MAEDGMEVRGSSFLGHIVVAKTIAMFVLGVGSFVLGVLPMKFITKKWWYPNGEPPRQTGGHSHPGDSATDFSPLVSRLLCFGGGVLLFTTLLHLQPEVREAVTQLQHDGQLFDFHGFENLGDLIFCSGFFLVFIIDQVVHTVLDSWYEDNEPSEEVLHRSMSLRRRTPSSRPPTLQTPTEPPATSVVKEHMNESSEERYRPIFQEIPPPSRSGEERRQVMCDGADAERQASRNVRRPAGQSFRGLFAVMALSFHEVFEGMAIGLEERVDHTWYLFFAVATHKLIIAFCIGLELAWLETKRAIIITYVATFAFVTPVGIAIGMLLVHFGDDGTMDGSPGVLAVVLQGLAAGTLLYVVFFEVLARHKQSGFSNLMAIILGFCVMLVLQMISHNHSHNHSHSHSHGTDDNFQHFDHGHVLHEHAHHDHHDSHDGHDHDH
ncbi:unnamed protein product [Macrosiphum euphorbiae]|uniref:Zinc transporter ZIP1 n=1 Tax=Macrosiphum euphorbiae TaxID=13131 RepID=A0AAV0W6Y3_9HEMI|nr:unnamed protein product [Macrosiphum euphorbiae]